jgi:Fic family protein
MKRTSHKRFSQVVNIFHDRALPEKQASLVGYSALIKAYDLPVPLPDRLALVSQQHRRYETESWAVFTPRHAPNDSLIGHLAFALRYEGVDLAILHVLFERAGKAEIEDWVQRKPQSRYARRAWFFYEWLLDCRLKLSDATTGNFVNALDPAQYCVGSATLSRRHRVYDNLPGVRDFCPLVRRTAKIEGFLKHDWQAEAHKKAGEIHRDVLARAAAFLLLKDSKASFAIEGETPSQNRAERWGQAIGQAGLHPLTIDELLRLQRIVIADSRFMKMGLRKEGGFIGMRDRDDGSPLPDHISARWQDLHRLLEALIETDARLREDRSMDPVIAATMIAFGFVFIHPFTDGNGRIHRYLIHHVLAERNFAPRGIVFPVSAVILERIDDYRHVLESYSRPRLRHIEWQMTPDGNVKVLNESIDLYRYFDATRQAEFLYECVTRTIEHNLPEEIRFLQRYDSIKSVINNRFDMPDHKVDLLVRFLRQNHGVFSKRAIQKEFKALTATERSDLEALYAEIFEPKAKTE